MIYKIYEGLSDYLIAPDGTAVEKQSGNAVPFEKSNNPSMRSSVALQAKLITDEQFIQIKGKKKPIRLVRRFTREDLLKMYARAKDEFVDEAGELKISIKKGKGGTDGDVNVQIEKPVKTNKSKPPKSKTSNKAIAEKEFASILDKNMKSENPDFRIANNALIRMFPPLKIPYLFINGVEYQSARSAHKALGVAVNTVLTRAKKNKDGWFYIASEFEHLQKMEGKLK